MQFFIFCPDCRTELTSINEAKVPSLIGGFIKLITIKRYICLECGLRVHFRFFGKKDIMVSAFLPDLEMWEEFTMGERY